MRLQKAEELHTAKEIINRVKKATYSMGENMYKELLQLANTKNSHNSPTKKTGKNLNRHFSKEDIQMANRYMKICEHHYSENANQNQNELLAHPS
jgi:hypothetical protein